jgi:hypothetical protein
MQNMFTYKVLNCATLIIWVLLSFVNVLYPGKGVCADPVNGGAILGKGGTKAP